MKTPSFFYFDLGKVLLEFDHGIAVNNLAALRENQSAESIRKAIFESDLPARYEIGQITTSQFCDELRHMTGIVATDEAISIAVSDIFSVNAAVLPIVTGLHRSGFPVGILSNTCAAHWDFIQNRGYGFLELFPVLTLSFLEESAKPDARIYECAAHHAGVHPEQIFFVDDLQDNVNGARRCGFDSVLYESPRQLLEDLYRRGVHING